MVLHIIIIEFFSWNKLKFHGKGCTLPWLVSGDFNEMLFSHEKKGEILRMIEGWMIFVMFWMIVLWRILGIFLVYLGAW